MLFRSQYSIILVSFDAGHYHGQCAMPICLGLCQWSGPGCRVRFKVSCTIRCVIIICHLAPAKLGWRERSVLYIDGYRGLWDPSFFHAPPGAASSINSFVSRRFIHTTVSPPVGKLLRVYYPEAFNCFFLSQRLVSTM